MIIENEHGMFCCRDDGKPRDAACIDNFKKSYGFQDHDFLLIPYGSRVYGTHSDKSDYDFMAIVSRCASTGTEFRHDNVNIHIYTMDDWREQLKAHKIHTLEGYFHPDKQVRKRYDFKLDLSALRNELSAKSSHSFVKAKKKIDKEKDYYVGWKSLFHSLRILNFGTQLAKFGEIKDFGAANHHWFDILGSQQYGWDYFKEKYQPIYNDLATEFRKVAPK